MKTHFNHLLLISAAALSLTGCASYNAAPLNAPELIHCSYAENKSDLLITAKIYDRNDCKRYLDRDVIAKGYQPVQLYIQNNSDKSYLFSLNRIDLAYARPEEVARKVHTSTVGRILGYGVPGVVLLWPLIIPAVVDGIKSSEANEALDNDFLSKIAKDQTIRPHSYFNKIIFVPLSSFQPVFNVTLIDLESNQPKSLNVVAS